MFVLKPDLVAPWPVDFDVVSPDGAVAEQSLTLRFRRMGVAEFHERWRAADAPADAEAVRLQNRVLFDRCVAGWADVVGPDGEPLPFEDPWIDRLLDFPGFAEAFGRAYLRFFAALPEEREKNSQPSRAGGPAPAETAPSAVAMMPPTG